jgi:hypothetical protein
MRVMGMLHGGLKHAHAELGALVGPERSRHQIRQYQLRLAKLLDDPRFHNVSGVKCERLDGKMPALCGNRIAPDQSSFCHNQAPRRRTGRDT